MEREFLEEAVKKGYLSREKAAEAFEALASVREAGLEMGISTVLIRKGFLKESQVDEILVSLSTRGLTDEDQNVLRKAIQKGYLDTEKVSDVIETLRAVQSAGVAMSAKTALLRKGYVTEEQAAELEPTDDPWLSEAVRRGWLNPEQARECLRMRQAASDQGTAIRLADVAIRLGMLTESQTQQIDLVVSASAPARQEPVRAPARRTYGPYAIVEVLSEDATGSLYRARKPEQGKNYLVRIFPPEIGKEEEAQLRKEAKLRVGIQGEGVLRAVSYGLSERRYYCAMEDFDGVLLSRRVREQGPLTERQALVLARTLAAALERIHAAGLLHLQVQPDRILINEAGEVRLMEAGFLSLPPQGDARLFHSPERKNGGKVDERSDVYSVGAVVLFAVTGEMPPPEASAVELARQYPDLSTDILDVLEKTIRNDREKRYPSAGQMKVEVQALLRGAEGIAEKSAGDGRPPVGRTVPRSPARAGPQEKKEANAMRRSASDDTRRAIVVKQSPLPMIVAGGVALAAIVGAIVAFAILSGGPEEIGQKEPVPNQDEPEPVSLEPIKKAILELAEKGQYGRALEVVTTESRFTRGEAEDMRKRVRNAAIKEWNGVLGKARAARARGEPLEADRLLHEYRKKIIGIKELEDLVTDVDIVLKERGPLPPDGDERASPPRREDGKIREAQSEMFRIRAECAEYVVKRQYGKAIEIVEKRIEQGTNNEILFDMLREYLDLLRRQEIASGPKPAPTDNGEVKPSGPGGEGPRPMPERDDNPPENISEIKPPEPIKEDASLQEIRDLAANRQFADALPRLAEYLSTHADSGAARGLKARIHAEMGQMREALDELEKAAAGAPEDPEVLFVRGMKNAADGNHQAAVEDFIRALPRAILPAGGYALRARSFAALKRFSEARKDAEAAERIDSSPAMRKLLFPAQFAICMGTGEIARASRIADEWINAERSKASLVAKAEALKALGKIQDARKKYMEAKTLDPADPDLGRMIRELENIPRPPRNEKERQEMVAKKMEELFHAAQKKVERQADGRLRVLLTYDFLDPKQNADWISTSAKQEKGFFELQSKKRRFPSSLVWKGKLRGDFKVTAYFHVTSVSQTEVAWFRLRSSDQWVADGPGQGCGIELENVELFDLRDWHFIAYVYGQDDKEPVTEADRLKCPRVRVHPSEQGIPIQLWREGVRFWSKFGQAPPIAGVANINEPFTIRFDTIACTFRIVRVEITGFLDHEWVRQVATVPPVEGTAPPPPAGTPGEQVTGTSIWNRLDLSEWTMSAKDGKTAGIFADMGGISVRTPANNIVTLSHKTFTLEKGKLEIRFYLESFSAPGFLMVALLKKPDQFFSSGNLLAGLEAYGGKNALVIKNYTSGTPEQTGYYLDSPPQPGYYKLTVEVKPSEVLLTFLDKDPVRVPVETGSKFRAGLVLEGCSIRILDLVQQ